MSRVDVQNTCEAMFREGFTKGFEAAGGDPRNMPTIHFEWRNMQPIVTFNRPRIGAGRLWLPKKEQN